MIAAILALAWSLVFEGGPDKPGPIRKYYLHILVYGYIIVLLPPIFASKRVASALTIFGGIILVVILAADLTALRFFGSPFLNLYPYLPVTAGDASLSTLVGYAASYVPTSVWLLATAAIGFSVFASRLLRKRGQARLTFLLLMPMLYLAAWVSTLLPNQIDPRIAAIMEEPGKPLKHLTSADRSGSFSLSDKPRAVPSTILFIIMESTGASTPSSDGKTLLSQSLIDESRADRWIDFRNAVTNSNATNISVPSLLTGSGAHESSEKVHALPFVSQYAAAQRYRTAFVTSSTMRWAGFDSFISSAQFDTLITGDDSGLPFINDLAVDDHFTYSAAADAIEKADSKLFLTIYPQSLHWPFQADSRFDIPAHIKDRRARAAYIAEAGFRMLFDALHRSGRMDDALIVVVGDHGEFDYRSDLRIARMRLDTFADGILSPIFLIKAPASLSSSDFEALAANSDNLVANHDLAPTIADMLGGKLRRGLTYDGRNLFRPVPGNRVVYSTATNEWRHWTTSAIAVARGHERMTCDAADLCRLVQFDEIQSTLDQPARADDSLFRLAAQDPVLRRAIGQIYRTYYY